MRFFMLFVLTEGTYQLAVLIAGADGDAQTVVAELHTSAVAYDDALTDQVVVDALGIRDLCQKEIGIGGIYLVADRQLAEGLHHAVALLQDELNPAIYLVGVAQHLDGLLLCELVDIIGILHLVEDVDDGG